jgi:hypothetical protein
LTVLIKIFTTIHLMAYCAVGICLLPFRFWDGEMFISVAYKSGGL